MPKCPYCIHSNPPGVDHCQFCGALTTDPKPPDDASPTDDIRSLVAQGKKIEAIKRYRERTGAGLKEAKDAVEAPERRKSLLAGKVDDAFERELISLVSEGAKIRAIKLYRERPGSGLKESKDAVESLAAQHGIVMTGGTGIGSLVVVLLFVLGLAANVLVLFR